MQGVCDKGETASEDTSSNLSQGQDPVRPDGDSNALILGLSGHMHMVVTHWTNLVWYLCIEKCLLHSASSVPGRLFLGDFVNFGRLATPPFRQFSGIPQGCLRPLSCSGTARYFAL